MSSKMHVLLREAQAGFTANFQLRFKLWLYETQLVECFPNIYKGPDIVANDCNLRTQEMGR